MLRFYNVHKHALSMFSYDYINSDVLANSAVIKLERIVVNAQNLAELGIQPPSIIQSVYNDYYVLSMT